MAVTFVDAKGLAIAFATYFSISVGIFMLFTILLRPKNRVIYEPKSKFCPNEKKPPPLSNRPTSWIQIVLKSNINDFVEKIGLDAFIFLAFVRFLFKFFFVLTFIAVPLMIFHALVPQGNKPQPSDNLPRPSLSFITVSNVPGATDSPYQYFYLHVILAWMFTLYAFHMLINIWKQYIFYRQEYFKSPEYNSQPHSKTILFTSLPAKLQSEAALAEYLNKCALPCSYKSILIGRDILELPKLVEEHTKYTLKLEKAILAYEKNKKNKRPTHKEGSTLFCIGGIEHDSIDFYSQKILELESKIYAMRAKGDDSYEPNTFALVSFRCVADAHAAAKKLRDPTFLNVQKKIHGSPPSKLASNFDELYWNSVGMSSKNQKIRGLISSVLLVAIIVGWSFLLTFVAAFTQIQQIRKVSAPVANFIESNPVLTIFVSSYLGPILLLILNLLLPILLVALSKYQGVKSFGGVQKSALYKYTAFLLYQFAYLILVVVIYTILTAIFSGNIANLSVLNIMSDSGTSLLAYANTYTILITQGTLGYALEIAQLAPLILSFIKRKFFSLTPRERSELNSPPEFQFLVIYGQLIFALTYGFTYALVAPIIVPFCCIAFGICYMAYKYQFFYVYETKHETGGTYWPVLFNLLMAAFVFAQFLNTAVVTLFNWRVPGGGPGKGPVVLMVLLPVFTAVAWSYINYVYAPQAMFVKIDPKVREENQELFDGSGNSFDFAERVYNPDLVKPLLKVWVSPEMKTKLNELHPLQYTDLVDYINKTAPGDSSPSTSEVRRRITARCRAAAVLDRAERKIIFRRNTIMDKEIAGITAEELEDIETPQSLASTNLNAGSESAATSFSSDANLQYEDYQQYEYHR